MEDFFDGAKKVMRALDTKEPIKPSFTLTFTEPSEMLHFLSEQKIKLIHVIRAHPSSITHIARTIKRNRAAVYRDSHEMEQFGFVKTHEEINPGHGEHKIVELAVPTLKLEAMGLSVSDAIRLLMLRIADEQRMPFEVRVPNKTTMNAIPLCQDSCRL